MAVTEVVVPNAEPYRSSFVEEVSTVLDAGNDVLFVDDVDGSPAEIAFINIAVDGEVEHRGKSQVDADSVIDTLVAGGWHSMGSVGKLFAAGTDASLVMNVRAG